MIVEYAEYGNLRDFLRKCREMNSEKSENEESRTNVSEDEPEPGPLAVPEQSPHSFEYAQMKSLAEMRGPVAEWPSTLDYKRIIHFALQIADGMQYLASKRVFSFKYYTIFLQI